MKTIFDPINIGGLHLKNRIVRSATWEGLANADGTPPEQQIAIYDELARGGVGAIIAGFTSVSSDDHYFDGMMRLSDDKLIPSYRQLTETVKKNDCAFLTQLALGAYYKANGFGGFTTLEIDDLEEDDIQDIIKLFTDAAIRAQQAGFDGVQIHAAHNFFLSRCISPAYNHRTDNYGGTPQKRAKIVVDILNSIRSATSLHISMKINCSDFFPAGLSFEDSLIACREVAANGVDSIEVSGNGTSRTGIRSMKDEAYFLDFAVELKKHINTPVILVGGHRSIENMTAILNDTPIELLSLSRPLIREPNLVNRWQSGDMRPSTCISCNACYRTHAHLCIFNRK